MVWVAMRAGLLLRLRIPRWRPEVKEFLIALGNATIGAGSVQIGLFIDTLIASFLPSGDLTALYYADRINQLPMGIIGIALGTVLLPEMSSRLAAKDEKGASIAQNRAVVLGMLLTLPCIAAFFLIPETLMRALHLGVMGLALGTSAGAWVNLGILAWLARRRSVLVVTPELKRAILPVLAAATAAAGGFVAGVPLGHAITHPGRALYDVAGF